MRLETALATQASRVEYDQLPQETVEAARRAVLWTVGSMIAGSQDAGSDKVLAFAAAQQADRRGPATIIGGGGGFSVALAGYANGVYAKALEYEDKFWIGNSHAYAIAVATVPAAFAAAEHRAETVSGQDLLTAVAAGTDAEIRMVAAAPHAIDTPFNSTYLFGHLGAAAAAGRIFGLSAEAMLDALGLAYTQIAGTYQAHHEGSLAVRMQMGACVRNGLQAALLAGHDVDGPHEFLTGTDGLYPTFFRECESAEVLDGIGRDFRVTRLGFKGYPCCAAMHQALDAVLELRTKHGIRPERVAAVRVHGAPSMEITCRPIEAKRRPANHVEQSFSLPWSVACLLTAGRLTLADFRERALSDPTRTALAQMVSAELDAPDDGVYAEIELSDGDTVRSAPVGAPTGHPDNPLPLDRLVERYRDCSRNGLPGHTTERTEQALDLMLNLEKVDDATHIVRTLG
ncbi:MmgE/PrpD family protein [Actinophytocola sp.]|uniref:MmgE/PrpD family protein n=1 Tax=Actinophytocola sp. TaxID=1872138 RepID=UPI003D6AA71A